MVQWQLRELATCGKHCSALVNRNNTKKEKNQVIPWLLHLILALHKPWAPLTSDLRRISDAISVHSA
jgi:predicted nucleic acid-binding Zn ribbon protein